MFLLFSSCLSIIEKVFIALGNDHPEIIIRVEDEVLKAIVGISEGRPRGELMDVLHAQIGALEQELAKDEHALDWFDFTTTASSISSTPPPAEARPTPMPGAKFLFNLTLHLNTIQQYPFFKPSLKVSPICCKKEGC